MRIEQARLLRAEDHGVGAVERAGAARREALVRLAGLLAASGSPTSSRRRPPRSNTRNGLPGCPAPSAGTAPGTAARPSSASPRAVGGGHGLQHAAACRPGRSSRRRSRPCRAGRRCCRARRRRASRRGSSGSWRRCRTSLAVAGPAGRGGRAQVARVHEADEVEVLVEQRRVRALGVGGRLARCRAFVGWTWALRLRVLVVAEPGSPATFTLVSPPWQSVQPRRTDVRGVHALGVGRGVAGHAAALLASACSWVCDERLGGDWARPGRTHRTPAEAASAAARSAVERRRSVSRAIRFPPSVGQLDVQRTRCTESSLPDPQPGARRSTSRCPRSRRRGGAPVTPAVITMFSFSSGRYRKPAPEVDADRLADAGLEEQQVQRARLVEAQVVRVHDRRAASASARRRSPTFSEQEARVHEVGLALELVASAGRGSRLPGAFSSTAVCVSGDAGAAPEAEGPAREVRCCRRWRSKPRAVPSVASSSPVAKKPVALKRIQSLSIEASSAAILRADVLRRPAEPRGPRRCRTRKYAAWETLMRPKWPSPASPT